MESPSTGLGEVCHRTRSIVSTERTPWAHLCMCMRHHKHQKRTTGHVWPYMLVPVPATRVIKCGITSTESAQLGMSGHAWLSLCLPHTSLSAACTVLGTRAQQHARICCTHTHTHTHSGPFVQQQFLQVGTKCLDSCAHPGMSVAACTSSMPACARASLFACLCASARMPSIPVLACLCTPVHVCPRITSCACHA